MENIQKPAGNGNDHCLYNDDYKHNIYTSVYIVVFIFGLLFNGTALYVFFVVNKKKGIATTCLINLAIADLTFICFLPLRIAYYRNGATWIFGDALCRITTYSFYFSMYSSILILASISIFRYFAVVFPGSVNARTAVKVCTVVWIFSGVSTSPFFLSGTQDRENVTRCFEPSGKLPWAKIMYINYYALICGFLAPFSVTMVFNGLLIRHIRNMPLKKTHIRKHMIMIALVLLVFSVCFLPYHIQRTVHLHYLVHHPSVCSLHDVLQRTVVATLCLAILNSCLDPLLYVFIGHGFKSWLCKYKTRLDPITSSSHSGVVARELVDEMQMEDVLKTIDINEQQ
ncbi:hypothetical protein GDO86_010168 [Hymenochirus boettgeri]|uniref:G-protein coupled receptors family 1 profile domain-containing protein n=1 Tax=Hymenochirus boettgeri TaxID=247094 RepID=A0A8T2JPI1_9PIPI|nr:hypothetical protein GDO86_010168 [Hymenochirus boettgeri]